MMVPDTSRWRSSSTYDYVDGLSASDIAWEWLRRNRGYQADYHTTQNLGTDQEQFVDTLRNQWGLYFRRFSQPRCNKNRSLLVAHPGHIRGATHNFAGVPVVGFKPHKRFRPR